MGGVNGFAKAVVDRKQGIILGFHIIGPHAPLLIQEVVDAMSGEGTIDSLARGIHIHPALSELIPAALGNLGEPELHG
jgi:dihydrolipoamide dehydrogenase